MMKNREQAERHSAASVGVVAFLSNGDPAEAVNPSAFPSGACQQNLFLDCEVCRRQFDSIETFSGKKFLKNAKHP